MIYIIFALAVSILTIFYLVKIFFFKKSIPLPPTILYYVAKNANFKLLLKISQTSKSNLKFTKRVLGYDVDALIVHPRCNIECEKHGWGTEAFIRPKMLAKVKNSISPKSYLEFNFLKIEDFDLFMHKIDITKMEEAETRSSELIFFACEINQQIFEPFLNTKINYVKVSRCTIKDYDILLNALKYMTELNSIWISWIPNVTSFDSFTKIKRKRKLSYCRMDDISEIIDPSFVVQFWENVMESDGYLDLIFDFPVEDSYINEILQKTSENVWINSPVK